MSSATVLKISLSGAYQERAQEKEGKLERAINKALRLRPAKSATQTFQPMLDAVAEQEDSLKVISDEALQDALDGAVSDIYGQKLRAQNLDRIFAILREVCWRTLGKRHFNVQMMGAAVMLGGGLAEMQTGEGKTLTAALAAATAALAGKPVHVISKVAMRMNAWLNYLTSP